MTPVEMYVALDIPPVVARDATMSILRAIGEHKPPYDHLALTIDLHDLQLPVDADINVPVRANVTQMPTHWEAEVEIVAESQRRLFPRFTGTVTVKPDGNNKCQIWLQGQYDVPMGMVGTGIDATFLHGAAERSLHHFLEWLATEVQRVISAQERDHMMRARGPGM